MRDLAAHFEHQDRLATVQRHIMCPVTGAALDIRTAVFLTSPRQGERVVAGVMSPAGFKLFCTDGRGAQILATYPEARFITDTGRDLTDKITTEG